VATELYPFQLAEHLAHRDARAWGYCWEMGCGKTAGIVADAAYLFRGARIDRFLALAPNGVHRAWAQDELPKHLPDDLPRRIHCWSTASARTRRAEAARAAFLAPAAERPLLCLCVSYDALMTEDCAKFVRRFLDGGPALAAADESQMLKSPDARRTKRCLALAAHAPYRRIATGTIVPDRPFDVYAQLRFLDPDAWRAVGCGSFFAFKAAFGRWEDRYANGHSYPALLGYRNLEAMRSVVDSLTSRVRKADVLPELPPKTYRRVYFELSPAQRRAYRELRDEAMTVLAGGETVTAQLVITRLLRMQQVTSGYAPSDLPGEDGERAELRVGDDNPRLDALLRTLEGIEGQAIVWCRFRRDVGDILAALAAAGETAARYDGACSEDEARAAVEDFRAGRARFFVSNPSKGGTGLTLNEAGAEVFYNTSHKLAERLQAEDRAHRIGQRKSVQIVDLVAMDGDEPTLDLAILRALASKREIAAQVQGDEMREWLSLDRDPRVG